MLVAIPEAPETTVTTSATSSTTTSAGSVRNGGVQLQLAKSTESIPSGTILGPRGVTQQQLHQKLQEIRGETDPGNSGGGGLVLLRRVPILSDANGTPGQTPSNGIIPSDIAMMEPLLQDQAFQQQILQLKQEQELQHQMLLQRFQAQRQQLVQAHEKQMQQRLKEYWEQKRREEEERSRLEAIRKKEKHEESAVASSEVKQKLQGFLLSKKQREQAAAMAGGATIPNSAAVAAGVSPLNPANASAPGSGPFQSHPYRRPLLIAKYEDDFPLRKTASEPNLLKMRLKQRVLERRSSPLSRRRERSSYLKRRSCLAMDGSGSAGSTPDSGPNSPPISCNVAGSTPHSGSGGGTPQHDEGGGGGGSPYGNSTYGPNNSTSVCDLTLYSSPSLPNISLGRPIPPNTESKLAAVSENEVRCPVPPTSIMSSAGVPLLPMPFYGAPHIPMDPAELEALYRSGGIMALASYQAQAAQALSAAHAQAGQEGGAVGGDPGRIGPGRTIHRPLGRTQSAPLPLGHPMLMMPNAVAAAAAMGQIHPPNGTSPTAIPGAALMGQPPTAHQLLQQRIRQTVLTRVGSRGQMIGPMNRGVSVEEDSCEGEIDSDEASLPHTHPHQQREYVNKMVQQHIHLKQQQQQMPEGRAIVTSSSTSTIPNPVLNAGSVSAIPQRLHHSARPLSRALSSPLVALGPSSPQDPSMQQNISKPGGTGLAFDSLMLKHQCLCGDNSQHPEHPGRLQSIWARLQETGLITMCERIRTRKATLEEIQSCHSEAHTLLFGTNPLSRQRLELSRFLESSLPIKSLVRLPCNGIGVDSDTTWNELHTPSAARMSAGCVIELALKVATNELRNGFAIVRPPGHHAEPVQAMGFCFFNSVAIAARQLRSRLQMEKILIVDWDIHHGNGTQQIFYDDPHVLYMSIHRHDEGNFFPGTGGPSECGIEDGMGFTVNIPWSGGLNPPMGDAEYLAAFRTVVLPIAQDFQPDVVLVSCGFDAAAGHPAPLGGYMVSPACFGWMTQQLMTVSNGRIVLALEGGYDLPAICDSSQECVKALLGEQLTPIAKDELIRRPSTPAIETLLRTVAIQAPHWPCIKRYVSLINCSAIEAASATIVEGGKHMRDRMDSETVSAMASLSMHHAAGGNQSGETARDIPTSPSANHSSSATSRRRSSDMNEDSCPEVIHGTNEEPMDQDEPMK